MYLWTNIWSFMHDTSRQPRTTDPNLEIPWKPMKPTPKYETRETTLKNHENQPPTMKNTETNLKTMKTNQSPWKKRERSLKNHKNQPRLMKTVKLPRKAMKTNQVPWKTVKLPWKTDRQTDSPLSLINNNNNNVYRSIIMIMFILIIIYRFSAWPPARTRSTISPSARARCPIGERMMMMIYRQMDNLAPT